MLVCIRSLDTGLSGVVVCIVCTWSQLFVGAVLTGLVRGIVQEELDALFL
jgi:hypothetical protein